MLGTKLKIEAKVVKIYEECINRNGQIIRTIDVRTSVKSRGQRFRLTEVTKKPRDLSEENWYEFEVFLNGKRREGRHVNDLLIVNSNI